MNILELYDFAEENSIEVDNFALKEVKSMAVKAADIHAIAIDEEQFESSTELKTALAHELGHHATDSFYNVNNHLDVRSKHEYRADKWAVQQLTPKQDMISALKSGVTEVWELAEYFEVTEELIKRAMWIYFDKIIP